QPITQVFRQEDPVKVHLTLEDPATGATESIETTPEHPFHVSGRGFVPAGSLKPDDAVSREAAGILSVVRLIPGLSGTSEVLRVKNLTFEKRPFLAYDLEVGQDHTFFVGTAGVWVHNCGEETPAAGAASEPSEPSVTWRNGWRTENGKFASPEGGGRPGASAETAVWDAVEAKNGWSVVRGQVAVRDPAGQLGYYDGAAIAPRGRG